MRSIFRTSILSRDYDSILAALIGFWIIQVFSRHGGIGISPDSVIYMSTASNILHQGMIYDFSGWPMMDFPAGYPIFLAGLQGLTRMDILRIGPFLDGALFAALIFTAGWLMQRFSATNRVYKWIMLTVIILSPCLLEVYSMIWSETLFLLLILFFIVSIRPYLLDPRLKKILAPAIIAALACVTRYAGLSLILLGGGLILCIKDHPWKQKLVQLVTFGAIASSLFLLNLYRNHLVTGTLTGYREKAITSFGTNLYHFGTVLCDWLPFFGENYSLARIIACLFIILAAVLFILRWLRGLDFFSWQNIATAYFLVYAIFILAIASLSRFQQLDSRLLSPLCIPWLWSFTAWIPGWLENFRAQSRRIIAIVVLFLAAACMQYGQIRTYAENWEGIKYAGIPGYTEDQWRDSQTMDYIRHTPEFHRPGAPNYSNAYEGIWFLAGVRSDLLPHKEFAQDIKEMLREKRIYVIWFNDSINTDLVSIEYISQYMNLEKTVTFDDGTVYYFTRK